MTATPHNGKEEDFQLFMALLDGDRFEGRFRDGVHLHPEAVPINKAMIEIPPNFAGKPPVHPEHPVTSG